MIFLRTKVVYTALLGPVRDILREPQNNFDPTVDYQAFVDEDNGRNSDFKSGQRWSPKDAIFQEPTPRRTARAHKILSHELFPFAEYSLWIDGCLQLNSTQLETLIELYLKESDICVFRHKRRTKVAEEVEACIDWEKDSGLVMRNQFGRYSHEGFPDDCGLSETTAVLRRHTPAVANFNKLWWREVEVGSCRDQLSFDYCRWKTGLHCSYFEGTCMDSPHFNWFHHLDDAVLTR